MNHQKKYRYEDCRAELNLANWQLILLTIVSLPRIQIARLIQMMKSITQSAVQTLLIPSETISIPSTV